MKFLTLVLTAVLWAPLSASAADPPHRVLRVCADPNNLPFSNDRGEGFENKLAELIARELHADLEYTWWAQRRGFFRETLKAKKCDVVMGVPTTMEMVATTRPYYRSGYAFVLSEKAAKIHSLDSPELKTLRIGVPLVGDDGANPPPVHALAQRGIVQNVRGYSVFGDYAENSPPGDVVRAVGKGEVDLAIAWGPVAGYFARQESPRPKVRLIPEKDAPKGLPFAFDIGIGVRHPDKQLRAELDAILAKKKKEIDRLLASYDVPRR